MQNLWKKARQIRLLALDVDGVLTDGRLYFSAAGEELKAFNTLDGHGIKMLQASGVQVAIITGRSSGLVARRAADLGIQHLYQGREDKLVALQELWDATGYSAADTAYVGDDWPDLPALRKAALGIAVANAAPELRQHADWCTRARGGEGAVREVCQLLMQAQGTLNAALAPYQEL